MSMAYSHIEAVCAPTNGYVLLNVYAFKHIRNSYADVITDTRSGIQIPRIETVGTEMTFGINTQSIFS